MKKDTGGEILTSNGRGTYEGCEYELWKYDAAKAKMILGKDGSFSCDWDSSDKNNVLFRRGKKFGSDRYHGEIGNIVIDYKASYSPSKDGVSYMCVYGWTQDPLYEYYIIDNWGRTNKPPGWWANAINKGSIKVDGGTYDIFVSTRTNMPSIEGAKTFDQYWSVRASRRKSGRISVSEHFKKWESLGMPLGKVYEVAFTIEGFNSTGKANVKKNLLSII